MTHSLVDVAGLLPDLPQWVEIRGMLLAGQASIVGPVMPSPPAFVVLHDDGDVAGVVGRAAPAAIAEAGAAAGEILAAPEDEAWIARVLPDWITEPATLHTRPAGAFASPESFRAVRFMTAEALATATHVPGNLHDELLCAQRAGAPIAAAFEGATPVAFSYAGAVTERWWDISIDTLEPFRRRGYAQQAVRFLIAHYAAQGKEPVWGSARSNPPSAALARRLGFEPAGTLLVMSAPRFT